MKYLLLVLLALASVFSVQEAGKAQNVHITGGHNGTFGSISVQQPHYYPYPVQPGVVYGQPVVVQPPAVIQPAVVVPQQVNIYQHNQYLQQQQVYNNPGVTGSPVSWGLHSDRHNFEIHGMHFNGAGIGNSYAVTIRANGVEYFGSMTVQTWAANELNGAFRVAYGAAVCEGTVQIRNPSNSTDSFPSYWNQFPSSTGQCIFTERPMLYPGH